MGPPTLCQRGGRGWSLCGEQDRQAPVPWQLAAVEQWRHIKSVPVSGVRTRKERCSALWGHQARVLLPSLGLRDGLG